MDHLESAVPGTKFMGVSYQGDSGVKVQVDPATADPVAACEAVLEYHSDIEPFEVEIVDSFDAEVIETVLARGEVGGSCTTV